MRELVRAPWANQTVGPFVRFLAWVYVICGVVVVSAGIYFSVVEDVPARLPTEAIGLVFASAYIFAIFLFVALRGRAPSGWLPWK